MDAVDDNSEDWRKETVSFDAAYGKERIPAYLFLPRRGQPPYLTIVLFPSGYAIYRRSSRDLDLRAFDFIVRSGRALLYPVYQGTFDRRSERSGTSTFRDVTVQQMKDFFRSVDYLATRQEIDMQRLGYCGVSIGRLSLAPAAGARTAHQSGGRGVERAAVELATRDPADELRASRHHPVPHDQRP